MSQDGQEGQSKPLPPKHNMAFIASPGGVATMEVDPSAYKFLGFTLASIHPATTEACLLVDVLKMIRQAQ